MRFSITSRFRHCTSTCCSCPRTCIRRESFSCPARTCWVERLSSRRPHSLLTAWVSVLQSVVENRGWGKVRTTRRRWWQLVPEKRGYFRPTIILLETKILPFSCWASTCSRLALESSGEWSHEKSRNHKTRVSYETLAFCASWANLWNVESEFYAPKPVTTPLTYQKPVYPQPKLNQHFWTMVMLWHAIRTHLSAFWALICELSKNALFVAIYEQIRDGILHGHSLLTWVKIITRDIAIGIILLCFKSQHTQVESKLRALQSNLC